MKQNLMAAAMAVVVPVSAAAQTETPAEAVRPAFEVTFGQAPQASATGPVGLAGTGRSLLAAAIASPALNLELAAPRWQVSIGYRERKPAGDINWAGLVGDQMRVDGTMHLFRFTMEKATREIILHTRYVDGYTAAVKGYFTTGARWSDGDPFVSNNINHPLQGAVSSYNYTNNDRRCQGVQYGDPGYWGCVRRATVYSVVASVSWEWNPLMSESALGNVGRHYTCQGGKCTGEGGWTDFVVTPMGGLGMRLAGDIARAKLWPVLERHLSGNAAARVLKTALKIATDPARLASCAFRADFRGALTTRTDTGRW